MAWRRCWRKSVMVNQETKAGSLQSWGETQNPNLGGLSLRRDFTFEGNIWGKWKKDLGSLGLGTEWCPSCPLPSPGPAVASQSHLPHTVWFSPLSGWWRKPHISASLFVQGLGAPTVAWGTQLESPPSSGKSGIPSLVGRACLLPCSPASAA